MNNFPLNPAEIKTEIKNDKPKKLSKNDMKRLRNKTIKKKRSQQQYELENLVGGMTDGDSDDELAQFNPPPQAILQSQRDQVPEAENQDQNSDNNLNQYQDDSGVTPETFRSIGASSPPQNYTSYVPYYTQSANTQQLDGPKDALLEKLNYMIHLLEEQKEDKTGHVAEELILYSFLGVFVIFIVDSFARVGKYVR